MVRKLLDLYPKIFPKEAFKIASHTAIRRSGCVGRSAVGRQLDEQALKLATIARIRHSHSDYDELLMTGWEQYEARKAVNPKVNDILWDWQE